MYFNCWATQGLRKSTPAPLLPSQGHLPTAGASVLFCESIPLEIIIVITIIVCACVCTCVVHTCMQGPEDNLGCYFSDSVLNSLGLFVWFGFEVGSHTGLKLTNLARLPSQ